MSTNAERLRQLLAPQRACVVAPGCYDALTASLIEAAGFPAAYLSGASLAYTRLGAPDIGLVSASEVADSVAVICERIPDLPLIVDADTGYGNALNVQRTVRIFERAGAAAVQLEDQVAPKRCGHLAGKRLVETDEMVGKIRAALDARREGTLIVARTDAVAVEGLDRACDRAEAYVEAGADLLFVEAPRTADEMALIGATFGARLPLLANMIDGGRSPSRLCENAATAEGAGELSGCSGSCSGL